MKRLPLKGAICCAFATLSIAPAAGAAELFYGVTSDAKLVTFDSSSPGHIQSSRPLSGLIEGDRVVGLDIRPETGQIYALGEKSRLYVVNGATGESRVVGAGAFTPGLSGTSFGFDFNPTVDRIRVVSDTEQNLRLHPETGQVAGNDGALAYAGNNPANPSVGTAAYTNSVPGASSTELYAIDTNANQLVRIDPPNAGTLVPVGALGIDPSEPGGFDIDPNGNRAFASLKLDAGRPRLFSIDLATGKAAATASQAAIGADVVALAAAGQVADDKTRVDESISLSSTQLEGRLLAGGVAFGLACNETCTVAARVTGGGGTSPAVTKTIEGAGAEVVRVALTSAQRDAIRQRGTILFRLDAQIVDAAGNAETRTRHFRTR